MRIDQCEIHVESWPLLQPFRIARGAKTEAQVVVVELRSGPNIGRGECCPYSRYGESIQQTMATLQAFDWNALGTESPSDLRTVLLHHLPAGGARNAIDCALWDLEAKSSGQPVWQRASLLEPKALATCFTLSLDTPDAMAESARHHANCPLLKLKLGDLTLDEQRMAAVRAARPDARLICDANEGWHTDTLDALIAAAHSNDLELIEQPLPADDDSALRALTPRVPICADETAAPGSDIANLAGAYQAVNIKLDKTGGLTGALKAIEEARQFGLKIMVGSMVSTSLSMAPAALIGSLADWVDLDSPLLLANDRPDAMVIENGWLSPPSPALWG